MKRIALVMAVLLVTAGVANSQELGFTGGLNLANQTGDWEDNKMMLAFGGGIFGRLSPAPQIAIQPEVLFMMKGTKWDEGDEKFKLTYIDIPVLLMYQFPMEGSVTPSIFAGPYLGILLSAKDEFAGEEIDVKDVVKSTDFGLVFGAGVDIKAGDKGKFIVNGRYALGLSNANDFLPDELSYKNAVISFFVGYAFGLGQ